MLLHFNPNELCMWAEMGEWEFGCNLLFRWQWNDFTFEKGGWGKRRGPFWIERNTQ